MQEQLRSISQEIMSLKGEIDGKSGGLGDIKRELENLKNKASGLDAGAVGARGAREPTVASHSRLETDGHRPTSHGQNQTRRRATPAANSSDTYDRRYDFDRKSKFQNNFRGRESLGRDFSGHPEEMRARRDTAAGRQSKWKTYALIGVTVAMLGPLRPLSLKLFSHLWENFVGPSDDEDLW